MSEEKISISITARNAGQKEKVDKAKLDKSIAEKTKIIKTGKIVKK